MCRAAGIAVVVALAAAAASAQEAPRQPGVIGSSELVPGLGAPSDQMDGAAGGPALVVQTPEPKSGQSMPQIMTIDPEAAFAQSLWGKRVHDDLERRSTEIAAENDRLADQFSDEEQQLTSLRSTLSAEEFRKRADEFDKRVVEVRRARDGVARELQDRVEAERTAFFRAALPVLGKLMQERGAAVVLDQRAIFVSAESADVTETLVRRFDETVGPGPLPPATRDQQGADAPKP